MHRVAIKSFTFADILKQSILKEEILFFDKVLVPREKLVASKRFAEFAIRNIPAFSNAASNLHDNLNTLEFLEDAGLIELISQNEVYIDPSSNVNRLINSEDLSDVLAYTTERIKRTDFSNQKNERQQISETTLEIEQINCDFISRMIAIKRNFYRNEIVFPLLDKNTYINENFTRKNEVYCFVLSDMATPSISTSWKDLIEFKDSQESQRKLYQLIDWINEVSHSDMSVGEIIDRYRYLYSEYEHRLRLHKMKYKKSTLQLVVNTTLELIENALKLKFSKIAETFFSLENTKIEMMEAEANIVGREIAYIFDVKSNNK